MQQSVATVPGAPGAGEEGDVIRLPEKLTSTLRVGRSGRFAWHVNPSTRPIANRVERWTLACRSSASDPVRVRRKVAVDRGERVRLGLVRACG
jgi:hypothetical protein